MCVWGGYWGGWFGLSPCVYVCVCVCDGVGGFVQTLSVCVSVSCWGDWFGLSSVCVCVVLGGVLIQTVS